MTSNVPSIRIPAAVVAPYEDPTEKRSFETIISELGAENLPCVIGIVDGKFPPVLAKGLIKQLQGRRRLPAKIHWYILVHHFDKAGFYFYKTTEPYNHINRIKLLAEACDPGARNHFKKFYQMAFISENWKNFWLELAAMHGGPLTMSAYQEVFGESVRGMSREELQNAAEDGSAAAMAELVNNFSLDIPFLYRWMTNPYNCGKNLIGKLKDPAAVIRKITEAAVRGSSDCYYLLGEFYSKIDRTKFFYCYFTAAQCGRPIAQWKVGLYYKGGKGACIDLKNAIKWLKRSAEEGNADAQVSLAKLYLAENMNHDGAFFWLSTAADQGNPYGQYKFAKILSKEYEEKASELFSKAFRGFLEYAEHGNIQAQYKVGMCYLNGVGIPRDEEKARAWLFKAALQNHYKAGRFML